MATKVALGMPVFRAWDHDTNSPLAGGRLYCYEPGTSTWKRAYKDAAGTTEWTTNPLILDTNGEAKIFWDGEYDLELYANDNGADGTQQWTLDSFNKQAESADVNSNGSNLILNPSFEINDGSDFPANWTKSELTGGTVSWIQGYASGSAGYDASFAAPHGRYGVNMNGGAATALGGSIETTDFIAVNDDAGFSFAFSLITSNAGSVTNLVEIYWYDDEQVQLGAGGTTTVYNVTTGGPTSFERNKYVIDPPSGARFAKVRLTGCATGSSVNAAATQFDDIEFHQFRDNTVQSVDTSNTSETIFYRTSGLGGKSTVTENARFDTNGDFEINTNKFTVDGATGAIVGASTINITGAATLQSTLDIQGNISNSTGSITLNDATIITGTLDARGVISSSTGNVSISDVLDIVGNTDITGTLTISSDLTVDTNRLFIDQSAGTVGIGTTSAAHLLTVHEDTSGAGYIQVTNTTTGETTADGTVFGINASEDALVWNYENSNLILATNNNERLRISSTGEVMIGTTTSGGKAMVVYHSTAGIALFQNQYTGTGSTSGLYVGTSTVDSDTYIWNYESSTLRFGTSNTGRMTINSAGSVEINAELGIGTDPSIYPFYIVKSNGTTAVARLYATTLTSASGLLDLRFDTDWDNNTSDFIRCYGDGTLRGEWRSDGDIWTVDDGILTSDPKLKHKIRPATSKLKDFMELEIINFEWTKEFRPKQVGKKFIGFNADNVSKVFPSLVGEVNTSIDPLDNPQIHKTIKMPTALLAKVIQDVYHEFKEELDELKAKLDA